jgi:hypothetical protein
MLEGGVSAYVEMYKRDERSINKSNVLLLLELFKRHFGSERSYALISGSPPRLPRCLNPTSLTRLDLDHNNLRLFTLCHNAINDPTNILPQSCVCCQSYNGVATVSYYMTHSVAPAKWAR